MLDAWCLILNSYYYLLVTVAKASSYCFEEVNERESDVSFRSILYTS